MLGNKGLKMIKPTKYSAEDLAGLEWKLDDFIKRESILAPQSALTYKNNRGETSVRFTDHTKTLARDTDSDQETDIGMNLAHIHLLADRIAFPKESGMSNLTEQELMELDGQIFVNKQLTEEEYLYYYEERNIRIGTQKEDATDTISTVTGSITVELMDEQEVSSVDNSPFDITRTGSVVYSAGIL